MVLDRDDSILAILPLMIKTGCYGKVVNSLPYYGSNGGILSLHEESHIFLLEYYYKYIEDVGSATYIENPLIKASAEVKFELIDERIGQFTSIGFNGNVKESLLKSFDASARRNIKKAIKSEVTVEIDNTQTEFLFETHFENITSINGKAKEKKFFLLLDSFFEKGKDYNIFVAKKDDINIAALLVFYYNKTVEYFTPVIKKEFRNMQPLSLIIYQTMIDANKKNYTLWNWGATWKTQEGVYKFKKKFGTIDILYKYFNTINNNKIYSSSSEELLKEYNGFYVIPFNKLNHVGSAL